MINSFQLRTLFEPDETFQYIDPINYLLLRNTKLTWDWICGIRSFIFPLIYFLPALLVKYFSIRFAKSYECHWTELFIKVNFYNIKIINGLMATFIDFFTIKVAEMTNINIENIVWITLLSPINWLYGPRSHINTFETFCVMGTLYFCIKNSNNRKYYTTTPIYIFICIGTYIRPVYLILSLAHLRKFIFNEITEPFFIDQNEIHDLEEKNNEKRKLKEEPAHDVTPPTFIGCSYDFTAALSKSKKFYFFNAAKALIIIFVILGWFISIDSFFYGEPVIPPMNFFVFNIGKDINKLFGEQPIYFYFLMLFTLFNIDVLIIIKEGIIFIKRLRLVFSESSDADKSEVNENLRQAIIGFTFFVPPLCYLIIHTFVPHKEMRFMIPTVPFIHIFIANSRLYNLSKKRVFIAFLSVYFVYLIGKYHQNYQIIEHLVVLMDKSKTCDAFICTVPYQHPLSLLLKDKTRALTGNVNIRENVQDLYEYKKLGTFKINEYEEFVKRLNLNLVRLLKFHKYKFIVIDEDLLLRGYDILKKYYKIVASHDYMLNILGNWSKKQFILELAR